MKTFVNPILKTEFTNVHGEKMTFVMDIVGKLWFHHEDCNKDFEPITNVFNYTMTPEEQIAIKNFIVEATKELEKFA